MQTAPLDDDVLSTQQPSSAFVSIGTINSFGQNRDLNTAGTHPRHWSTDGPDCSTAIRPATRAGRGAATVASWRSRRGTEQDAENRESDGGGKPDSGSASDQVICRSGLFPAFSAGPNGGRPTWERGHVYNNG